MLEGGRGQSLKLNLSRLCLVLGLLSPVAAQAADAPEMQLYRYIDNRGVTVLDRQGVPPEYVAKGYEVLNAHGRVVQVVPPAPTAEQIRQAEADKVQADADAQLLALYSSVADVDKAKARKLAEIDSLISVAQGNLQGLASQQTSLQSQAADLERAARPVTQVLIDQLADVREQRQRLQNDIRRHQRERSLAESRFAQDRARLEKMLK